MFPSARVAALGCLLNLLVPFQAQMSLPVGERPNTTSSRVESIFLLPALPDCPFFDFAQAVESADVFLSFTLMLACLR
jgi:hypothetical protein